jgi:hypothetical protein
MLAALVVLLAAGCQTARVEQPLTRELGGNDPAQQLEFWHRLGDQPVTSNDDAFHGLLLYLDGQDPAEDYAGRVRALKSRRLLAGGFDQPAELAVERGTLAVAIVRALDIKGGLAMRILGPTPRYAVRELVFMELYPPSSPHQTFSGAEFLGIIGKLEDHQRQQEASARGRPPEVSPQPPEVPEPAVPGERTRDARPG